MIALAFIAACQFVSADRIFARDVAAVVPAFAKLAPEVPLGFAPSPGQTKVFGPAELQRVAKANGLALDEAPSEICFQWNMRTLEPGDLITAMNAALPAGRRIEITVVESSRYPAPQGRIVFSEPPVSASGPMLWRGQVLYAPNRRYLIWARVLLKYTGPRLIAAEPLHPGEAIRADQLRIEQWSGTLAHLDELATPGEAVGDSVKAAVPAGTVLRRALLMRPADVLRGDAVAVHISSPGASITTEGIAEQTGVRGAVIYVRNRNSGRKFRARVEGKDTVTVPQATGG